MRRWRRDIVCLGLGLLVGSGCATGVAGGGDTADGDPLRDGAVLEAAALLEQARTLHYHRGDHEGALRLCQEVEASSMTSDLSRTEATVLRAELQAYGGDVEGAVETLEQHMRDKREQIGLDSYPGERKVSRLLGRLLVGWDFEPDFVEARAQEPGGAVAEIARMLPCEGRLQKYTFGMRQRQNAEVLSNAIDRAHHRYCDEQYQGRNRSLADSHSSSQWSLIPYVADELDRSMNTFVYDAASHPIPQHYAQHLPCEYAEIEAAVSRNQGLVAFDRAYDLPRILIAAPDNPGVVRTIEAFMALDALPEDGRFVLELGDPQ